MKKITNELIIEAVQAYIEGAGYTTRPFEKLLTDEFENIIDYNNELYQDGNGNVYFATYYEGNEDGAKTKYNDLMSKLDLAKNTVEYGKVLIDVNDLGNITIGELETIREAEEFLDQAANKN